jgi:hypothetical protein
MLIGLLGASLSGRCGVRCACQTVNGRRATGTPAELRENPCRVHQG